jgi:ribonuclease P protein component
MYKFTKAIRLRKKEDYDRTLSAGRRRATENIVVIAKQHSDGRARLGLIVSRKVGNSVVRNRVKRHLREIFRQSQQTLPTWDFVVIARPPARVSTFQTLNADFENAVKRLRSENRCQPA